MEIVTKKETDRELRNQISDTLNSDIVEYTQGNPEFRAHCRTILTDMVDSGLCEKLKILDVFDDLHTKDKAIKFYIQGKHTEARVFIRPDKTIWLEIDDLVYAWNEQKYERQELRLPGTASSMPLELLSDRRLPFNIYSVKLIIQLLLETKWKHT